MLLLLLTMPIVSTVAGGLLALRFRSYFPILIAIGAGLLLGAAFLDLLPEAISLGVQAGWSYADVLGLTLLCFLFFHACESGLDALAEPWRATDGKRQIVGRTGAAMLIFHSFRDGMAIGAAFAASHPAGYAVGFGIVAHDLGDGMNTIILSTGGRAPTRTDYLFLAGDALAPFLGGLLTSWLVLPARSSVGLLVLAAGFFLQMATGNFLPELRQSQASRRLLLPSVLLGASAIYFANLLVMRER